MKIDILAAAEALSNEELLAHIGRLAGCERSATAELVAHLAVLHARPSVYAAKGYGSLFTYCTQALKLSEDAACNRIEAAKACRQFPVLLDLLAEGSMTVTSVRILGRHLTVENHEAVIVKAKGRTRHQVEALVAELAPRPDVPTSVRKLPSVVAPPSVPEASALVVAFERPATTEAPSPSAALARPALQAEVARPIVQPTAPERYRVQFTIGQETHERLRRVQALLGREIPGGDPAAIFDRALKLLEAQVEKTRMAAAARPRSKPTIRPGTDKATGTPRPGSRHVPHEVKRVVWKRDRAQCAFVSTDGRRCTERTFLELHHLRPYARQGPATVGNIALRCRRHNQYEAEVFFGANHVFVRGEDSIRTPPPG